MTLQLGHALIVSSTRHGLYDTKTACRFETSLDTGIGINLRFRISAPLFDFFEPSFGSCLRFGREISATKKASTASMHRIAIPKQGRYMQQPLAYLCSLERYLSRDDSQRNAKNAPRKNISNDFSRRESSRSNQELYRSVMDQWTAR